LRFPGDEAVGTLRTGEGIFTAHVEPLRP
jgi:hypothetical protein